MNKPKLVSLFAGAGGLDLGFIKAGFEVVWANDFDENAVKTYHKNIGTHSVLGDITKINSSEIPDEVDVITGGFPCQGFSVANTKRNVEDKRNFLYKEMLRIIKDKQPKFFVAENVKGLLSLGQGLVIKMIEDDFAEIGYKMDYRVLNSADFGVPQNRERVIIIGNRLGKKNIFPEPTHSKQETENLFSAISPLAPHRTVKSVIGYLANIETVERNSNQVINFQGKKIYNHIAYTNVQTKFWKREGNTTQAEICDYLKFWRDKKGISTKKVDEYFGYKHTAGHWFRKDNKSGSIPKPSDWWKLKKLLGFDDKFDNFVTKLVEKEILFEQSLRITNWDKPSDTITASTPEIHINKKRRLSVRECAILQSFPDDFIFTGSLSSQHRQVGNAVPPLLAFHIAKTILSNIEVEK
jgi:DNA (cytosine-5)-methyltransferase 1